MHKPDPIQKVSVHEVENTTGADPQSPSKVDHSKKATEEANAISSEDPRTNTNSKIQKEKLPGAPIISKAKDLKEESNYYINADQYFSDTDILNTNKSPYVQNQMLDSKRSGRKTNLPLNSRQMKSSLKPSSKDQNSSFLNAQGIKMQAASNVKAVVKTASNSK